MKTKQICRLLAILWLTVLFLPFPAQADGEVLKWRVINNPGISGNVVVSPSEVNEITVGSSGAIYAIDSENDVVYQSLDNGATWKDITSRLVDAGAGLPASKLAIAPDESDTVAMVTDNGTEVYQSTDGGITWYGTDVPSLTGTIQVIAISKEYTEDDESLRDMAIGTADWGDNTTAGQVWVRQLGQLVPAWRNQNLTVDPDNVGGEVSAIAYSPSYQRDNTLVVVASTANDTAASYREKTWISIGQRNTVAGTTSWNAFSDYPVDITTASSPSAGDAVAVTRISSSLALPSNYSGSFETLRKLFVSYDRDPDANDDVYLIDDTTPYRLDVNSGAAIDISSIAYNGTITSGKLLAGELSGSTTVQVRRTSNPFDSSPTWHPASMPPSGPGNAKVSWSSDGDIAYCGTSQSPGGTLDESAFSISADDGVNWQQLSLMDSALTLSDITPVPDSKTLFVATYNTSGPEGIWRSASTQTGIGEYWSRQLTMNTSSDRVILRLSPDYPTDYTIYAAETGGNLMAVSHNRGNSWKRCIGPGAVVDIIVEDKDTLYAALSDGYILKSTNSAFTWDDQVYSSLPQINMLAITGDGTILVGGKSGEVAYSTDGGTSFTRIDKTIGTGNVQVTADANYPENGIIYAATDASDNGIWRWTIGIATSWEQIDETMTELGTGQQVGGLTTTSKGTLYALRLESASSSSGGITRSLNPAGDDAMIEFDFTSTGLPAGAAFNPATIFSNPLPYLKISGESEQTDLWTLDTANEKIYRFQDTLAGMAPKLLLPEEAFQNKVNRITGHSLDVSFKWNSPSIDVTEYELGIYTDTAATSIIQSSSVSSTSDTQSVIIGPSQTSGSDQFVKYNAGTTYYWRVRSTEPLKSPWSELRSFTVEPIVKPIVEPIATTILELLSPVNGAVNESNLPSFSWKPIGGVTEFRFLLADNPTLAEPIIDIKARSAGYALTGELEPGKTYYWAVKPMTPMGSGWSTLANFTVREKGNEIESTPPLEVREIPPPIINLPEQSSPPRKVVIPPYPASPETITPAYIWVIIIITTTLVVLVIVLILKTRRSF